MGTDHAQTVERATLEASRVEDLDRDELHGLLKEFRFARLSGLVSPEVMRTARARMADRFDPKADRATTGEDHQEVRSNFQKWSIGCARHGNVDRPRFMRTFYNPLWDEDIYGLHDAFRTQCGVRNLLGDMPLDFAVDREERGVWTAARIHHFPAGGGFMVGHCDTVLPAFYETVDLAFYQTLLVVTQSGEDYQKGGGFITVDGEQVVYDDYCTAGDIIVYDQNLEHGVADIDVDVAFRQDSLAGRMSGLVTLYKAL